MNGLRLMVLSISVFMDITALAEHHCSKYHYEEQILSKQIRMEIRLENLENVVKSIQDQNKPKTACEDEWIPFQNSCYWFGNVDVDFENAKALCASSGSFLVSIHNTMENSFIFRHISSMTAPYYWIGLTDIETEGSWTWSSTDEHMKYVIWNGGEPNGKRIENCVVLRKSEGKWADVTCTRKFVPICKK